MLWTKRVHQITIFQTFECSNESSPNSSCHFWNHKVRFYSNFPSMFSVMKDNSSVFCISNFVCFGQNEPIEKKFSDFSVVGWKATKFVMSYLKPQVSFSLNLASLFSVMKDKFLLCEVYNVRPKNVQKSFRSWHWRVMQNLKKSWVVISKMTWRIWQVFKRALE